MRIPAARYREWFDAFPADLREAWTQLRQGVSLGGVRLSPGAVLTFLVVFTLGYMVTRVVQATVRTSMPKPTATWRGAPAPAPARRSRSPPAPGR